MTQHTDRSSSPGEGVDELTIGRQRRGVAIAAALRRAGIAGDQVDRPAPCRRPADLQNRCGNCFFSSHRSNPEGACSDPTLITTDEGIRGRVISVATGSNFVDAIGEFLLATACLLPWLSARPRRYLVEAGRPVRPIIVRIRYRCAGVFSARPAQKPWVG